MSHILLILALCTPCASLSQGGAAVAGSPQAAVDGLPAAFPFFTVWRRPNVNAPWRYIAE